MKWIVYGIVALCVFVGLTEPNEAEAALIVVALVACAAASDMKH
jgi:hypothetical protein